MHTSGILIPLFVVLLIIGSAGVCAAASYPVPVQTVQPPANLSVAVQVDQSGSTVTATFRGGFGQMLLKEMEIQLVRPDSSNETQPLGKRIGDSVTFRGTGCGDQILGTATFMNGITYPFLNEILRIMPGVCTAGRAAVVDPCVDVAASPALQTQAVDEIPRNKTVAIQTSVDIQTINVEFRGGAGQGLVKSLQVTRYGPDGVNETKELENRVGSAINFTATNNCLDRVVADVLFMDGTRYHFYDKVLHISRTN